MDVITFLSFLSDNYQQLTSYSLVCFRADVDSALFFSQLVAFYKKKQLAFVTIDLAQTSIQQLKLLFDTLFLGQKQVYWVKNLEELDSAGQQNLLAYLNTYTGPHTIHITGVKDTFKLIDRPEFLVVELPSTIGPQLYKQLFSYFFPDNKSATHFSQHLFKRRDQITLDAACLIMRYHACAGQKSESFFEQWLDKLVVSEKSLFTLSQYFFARQPREFFAYWTIYKADYPDEFWIAYWLEQLWQAALFVHKAQTLGQPEAKKTAHRIPFSFINKDWRNYSYSYLVQAHHALYLLDYNLKNGIGNYGLELWYNKFFLR
jgi:hypothetical protein